MAYGDDVENINGFGGCVAMTLLAASLDGIEGDVTPETVIQTTKSMPETDYPGADGMAFQCGGSAFEPAPAVCTSQSLRATLDAEGNPTSYEPVDSTEILEGLQAPVIVAVRNGPQLRTATTPTFSTANGGRHGAWWRPPIRLLY